MVLVKSLKKRVDDLSYNAGVAKDYSREIHYDPDKKERIKELDQIIKKINDRTKYHFSEIIDNVNILKTALRHSARASQSEDSQREDSQGRDKKKMKNL